MATRRTPQRGHGAALWLFAAMLIFALLVGLALALDWIDPENSRLF
jgi:hypothetical protein